MKLPTANLKKSVVAVFTTAVLAAIFVVPASSGAFTGTADEGEALFKAKCVGCHGADGSGNTPIGKNLKIRDLKSAEVQGQTDAQLLQAISQGKGKMPGYEKSLGADKCKLLLQHVRALAKK
jgi:mono/diheme cytochrome c family protein